MQDYQAKCASFGRRHLNTMTKYAQCAKFDKNISEKHQGFSLLMSLPVYEISLPVMDMSGHSPTQLTVL